MIYARVLGKRCLTILDLLDIPNAFVATIKSCSLRDKICPLTILARPGQDIMARINITTYIFWVLLTLHINAKDKDIINGINGSELTTSVKRIRMLSTHPP